MLVCCYLRSIDEERPKDPYQRSLESLKKKPEHLPQKGSAWPAVLTLEDNLFQLDSIVAEE